MIAELHRALWALGSNCTGGCSGQSALGVGWLKLHWVLHWTVHWVLVGVGLAAAFLTFLLGKA